MKPVAAGHEGCVPKGERLLTYVEYKMDEVDIKRFLVEVFSNDLGDCAFDNERIIHGLSATDSLHAVPAGLTTTGDAGVHDVVTDENVGLELWCRTNISGCARA
jgi:hypothetical protein